VSAVWPSLAVAAWAAAVPCGAVELSAGIYSFSDELGGFRLVSAGGTGTPEDPIVIEEEFLEAVPVTLVVRRRSPSGGGISAIDSQLTLVKRVRNASKRVWAGFEMELQEVLRKPSVYSDGLSFKQFAALAPNVGSDSFTSNDRKFEPYDRIEFLNGHVDPDATAEFRIVITDPTPTREFYLVQDPKLLAASRPMSGRSFAALAD
jgi:hypothetical protein